MAKKQARGMIVVTMINGKLTAICQRRGRYKRDKTGAIVPESYAGGTQVTFHGGMEPSDDGGDYNCLRREGIEEVGETLWAEIGTREKEWKEAGRHETAERLTVTFAVLITDLDVLEMIRWHVYSGGLTLVDASTHILTLTGEMKTCGVTQMDVVAMHADERDAVLGALNIFAPSV